MKKALLRILKIIGITIGSILLLMFLLPMLFPGTIAKKIKGWANNAITSEVNFSGARLSFFNHFPALTLTLSDFTLKGSAPFSNDTLVSASEVALGINLPSLLSSKISIDEIYLTQGLIRIHVNKQGQANYNVYKSDSTTTKSTTDSSSTSLKIEKIQIEHSSIVYDDQSLPLLIKAGEVNYLGKGDLSKSVFELGSNLQVAAFDLSYNNQPYITNKKMDADLVTKINTQSLAFSFDKNDVTINSLPVKFKGRFEFLSQGYNMDFRLLSGATTLQDVFTALPPEYSGWLDKTTIKGATELSASLIGQYNAATNTGPDLKFNMKVRDGSIAHENAPFPVSNLFLNIETAIPGLNPDSLYVNIDSIFFNIDKDYFSSILRIKGLNSPNVYAKLNSSIDLGKWQQAIGIKTIDLKGRYDIHLLAEGQYATSIVQKGLRQKDTVVTSIPHFSLHTTLQNGYFKYASLPESVNNISFTLDAACPDNDYKHTTLSLDNLNASALGNYIKGFFHLHNAANYDMEGDLKTTFSLADIAKFYPLDSMQLTGNLAADIHTKGKYDPAKKLFPVTIAHLNLKDGSVQTKYYPHPIEKIQVTTTITNTSGNMKSLAVQLTPVSFLFEGQPFQLQANLKNFDNLHYQVTSNGTIDLGKIYKVFAYAGLDVQGLIRTNLQLNGLQSDATSGHYDRLSNSGTLELNNVTFTSDLFPQPFIVQSGHFRFNQDKIWFNQLKARYGQSQMILNGYLSNVINYTLQPKQPLKGHFDLASNYLLVDEFMAFADNKQNAPTPAPSTGVLIVPDNLSLDFTANVKKVTYNGLNLTNCKGDLRIDSSRIRLKQLAFSIIDAPVTMDATYGSTTPTKAYFDYHIKATDFNIKRAWNEIKLFHDMATSAGKAEGIVSLDYNLAGKLDANMHPLYPTLKGNGVLSLQQVKVKGMKLFGAVSKATNRDSINNPDLSKVDIKTSIANNIITIERTKLKVMGFRPRIEGQVSFDSKLNLRFRLGLPPFGIFGIPMTITGTQENPNVHLGKGKKEEELQEEKEED